MTSKYKILIVGGVVAILLIGGILYNLLFVSKKTTDPVLAEQATSTDEPIDIALDFYASWLDAVKSTSTNPYQSNLDTNPLLSKNLSAALTRAKDRPTSEKDPVICQTVIPDRVGGKVLVSLADTTQVIVKSRDKLVTDQTIITLNRLNDGWFIDNISCSSGEVAPITEFSFDKEGFLLKSVPPPLDPNFWYIIFEENNQQGHHVPLNFTSESTCIEIDGTSAPCDTSKFYDAQKVHVYGEMSESGATVKRLESIKE